MFRAFPNSAVRVAGVRVAGVSARRISTQPGSGSGLGSRTRNTQHPHTHHSRSHSHPRPRKPTYDGTGKLQANDSYLLSQRVRELSQRSKFDEALKLVLSESRGEGLANVVVWNQLLQESRVAQNSNPTETYKLFMDMKKRGITPNSRSYTILFRAFSGGEKDRPSKKTLEAALTVFRQLGSYHAYLREEMDEEIIQEESSVLPINAYLALLAKVAHSYEMMKIFDDMAQSGPSSPDLYTYTTIFQGLLRAGQAEDVERGHELWRVYFARLKQASIDADNGADNATQSLQRLTPDTALISNVLRLFTKGTPKDCKAGLMIAHTFLSVPAPSPFIERQKGYLPRVELNDRVIDSLFHLGLAAGRPSLVIRHADHLLNQEKVRSFLRTRSMFFALLACAREGDAGKAIEYLRVMRSLKHGQPDAQSFEQAMAAAMRAQNASYKKACEVWEMVQATKTPVDIRIMSSLMKASLNERDVDVWDALEKLSGFPLSAFFNAKTHAAHPSDSRGQLKHQQFWEHRLAKSLLQAVDRVGRGEHVNIPGKTRRHDEMLDEYADMARTVLGVEQRAPRKQHKQ
ncbi:hypothetical protein E3P92_02340 [Wallemia ichthyophaga]|nr:hypothetical protein E3P92_02340 [Wallemia ichthyophaga]TIB33879.1 hypothetical protein E3P84_01971 [Wallemia ichthyophaga]TIB41463.1 hypothetical protein E3P83_01923 [Wallemia ichthyophaga]